MITNRKIIPLDNIMQFLSYKSNGIICWEQRNLLIVCFQTTPKEEEGDRISSNGNLNLFALNVCIFDFLHTFIC